MSEAQNASIRGLKSLKLIPMTSGNNIFLGMTSSLMRSRTLATASSDGLQYCCDIARFCVVSEYFGIF